MGREGDPEARGRFPSAWSGTFIDDLGPSPTCDTPPSFARSTRMHGSSGSTRRRRRAAWRRRCPHRRRRRLDVSPLPGRGREARSLSRRGARGCALRRRAPRRRRRPRSVHGRGRARADRGRLRAPRRPCSTRSWQRRRPGSSPTARSTYGDPDGAFAAADLVVSDASTSPVGAAPPSSATASSPTGTRQPERSPPGRTSRVPSRFTRSPPPRSDSRAEASPDHSARLGRELRHQVDRLRLRRLDRARRPQARRPRTLDRGPHRAPRRQLCRDGRSTDVQAAFSAEGELLALRYDVVEDVGAYVRAPEPATLYRMHGSLSGAYRVQHVAARNRVVLTNRCPTGLNRGFGGPQLYLALERTMAIAAGRLGLDPAELAPAKPHRGRRVPLPHSLWQPLRLRRLRGLPRRRARARPLRGSASPSGPRARAEGRLVGIGLACVVEPSISNMGYVSLAETGRATRGELPKSGNAEGAPCSSVQLGGITVRIGSTPQGQGHATVCAQIVADCLGVQPEDVEVLTELDTRHVPLDGLLGELLVAVLGRRRRLGLAARGSRGQAIARQSSSAIRRHRASRTSAARRERSVCGDRRQGALEPGSAPRRGWSPASRDRVYARPNLDPPEPTIASPHRRHTASSSMSPLSRSTARRAGSRARLRDRA